MKELYFDDLHPYGIPLGEKALHESGRKNSLPQVEKIIKNLSDFAVLTDSVGTFIANVRKLLETSMSLDHSSMEEYIPLCQKMTDLLDVISDGIYVVMQGIGSGRETKRLSELIEILDNDISFLKEHLNHAF